jgi:hypothetical protein
VPKRHHTHCDGCARWLAAARVRLAEALHRACRALRCWNHTTPVEVLIVDPARRRTLERDLRAGLRQLRRALRGPFPAGLTVVVQQVITTDRQLAGCSQLGQRPDGTRLALVRLALQVNGRRLSTDELLAALAEQCIGLATRESPSVLVPIDFEPRQPAGVRRLDALRPDPFAPRAA